MVEIEWQDLVSDLAVDLGQCRRRQILGFESGFDAQNMGVDFVPQLTRQIEKSRGSLCRNG